MSRSTRTRSRLLVLVTTLVLLELVLQAGALIMWSLRPGTGASAARGDERVVLCAGDSFTYGIGSSSPAERSYPARLGEILRARGPTRWSVANCGRPGQDSSDVLRKLGAQLTRSRPSFVYLLAGINDFWSRPELHVLEQGKSGDDADSFRWTWRTGRLVALLRGMLRGTGKDGGANPGPTTNPATDDPVSAGWTAWRAGEFTEAEACFVRALALRPEDPAVRSHLAMTYFSSGRTQEMEEQLELVRRHFEAHPLDRVAAESYVGALAASGKGDEALARAQHLTTSFPDSHVLWQTIGCESMRAGDHDAALRALDRAITLVPSSSSDVKGYLHRQRAFLLLFSDPLETARSAVRAHLLDHDRKATTHLFQLAAHACTRENLARVCDELALAAPDRDAIMALFSDTSGEHHSELAIFARHMRQAIDLCRAAGATPVLLGYPVPHPELEQAMRALAAEAGAAFLPLSVAFAREAGITGGAELFAPDGHCNDRGYEVMARLVAEDLARR